MSIITLRFTRMSTLHSCSHNTSFSIHMSRASSPRRQHRVCTHNRTLTDLGLCIWPDTHQRCAQLALRSWTGGSASMLVNAIRADKREKGGGVEDNFHKNFSRCRAQFTWSVSFAIGRTQPQETYTTFLENIKSFQQFAK